MSLKKEIAKKRVEKNNLFILLKFKQIYEISHKLKKPMIYKPPILREPDQMKKTLF